MDFQATRDVGERHRVAQLRRSVGTADDLGADLQAVGCEDVVLLPVGVLDQGDVAGTVGIVFDRLHGRFDAVLQALEVDDAEKPLVPAAAVLGRDHAVVVAPGRTTLPIGERFLRRLLGDERLVVDHRPLASAGRGRVVRLNRHKLSAFSYQLSAS